MSYVDFIITRGLMNEWMNEWMNDDDDTLGHLIKWIKSGVNSGVNSGVIFFIEWLTVSQLKLADINICQ